MTQAVQNSATKKSMVDWWNETHGSSAAALVSAQEIVDEIQDSALDAQSEDDEAAVDESPDSTLYGQLGGEAAVDAAVDIFYRKVLGDDRISHFFEGVDMSTQAAKQKAFLTLAFGGPNHYSGLDMRQGHAHLVERGLNDSHFDAVMENLAATMQELNVPEDLIAQAAAIAESTRNDVLGR